MSASREKKIRQELASSGQIDPKVKKTQEEQAKQRRQNIGIAAAVIAFVLCAAALFLWNSKVIQRNAAAVRVDGTTYTAADLAYFCLGAYNDVLMNDAHGSEIDTDKPLDQQTSPYGDGTWFDHIKAKAADALAVTARQVASARSAGFDESGVDADLASVLEQVRTYASGSGVSVDRYLQSRYGALMTQKVFERNYRLSALANAYAESYAASLSFSDEEIQASYESDTAASDYVDFEYVIARIDAASDATDDEKAAAAAKARIEAEAILASYASGETLEDAADGFGQATYGHRKYARASVGSSLLDWLFDDSRKEGDTTVIDVSGGSYAVLFHSRNRSEEHAVSVRHILVSDADKANEVYEQWKSGPATEESFAALAAEASTDTGSSSNGGLYEGVYLGQMVEPFEDWCFDPARKPGDTDIVATDYGFHVMYYVGASDEPLWKELALSSLQREAYAAWEASLEAAGAPELLPGADNIGL